MNHEGERAVQRRAGVAAKNWGSARVNATIPPVAMDFLRQQRMLMIGAADDTGAVWASLLAGAPGFAEPVTERSIVISSRPTPQDPLAGLFETGRDLGMLAIEPQSRRRMRVNGRAVRDGDRLVVHTEQVYANCPKYIQTRDVLADAPASPGGQARTAPELNDRQRRWIADADTFFVASHSRHGTDTSHRGGNPGFVTVTGPRGLTWPDYVGNSMYMTLGNLELDPRCGLLFLDWERGHTLHLTGRARTDWDPDRAARIPGARRVVDFEVDRVVQVDQASPLRWTFGGYSRFNPPVS
ncbi:pyridoxamine 5'-phosphate oxidase family protein [Micromonospora sonneratiae]|uniref:Pyridoxamine 5'-phosphate oxidase family protein n=1 Tax=Micromonospora sonneratiae TaxID=1184706 RepID=A0ABW3YE82_9ACTN